MRAAGSHFPALNRCRGAADRSPPAQMAFPGSRESAKARKHCMSRIQKGSSERTVWITGKAV